MSEPSKKTTDINATIIRSNGLRINFTIGDGARRLIAITEGTDTSLKYPIDGVVYQGDLKYKFGDQLVAETPNSGDPYPYPYPDPNPDMPTKDDKSKTYVVYEGLDNGVNGIDIINLKQQTTYRVQIFEHTNYNYINSEVYIVTTRVAPNTQSMNFRVYDNITRLPIENASIAIMGKNGFIADTGLTDKEGKYYSLKIEEGSYTVSILSTNYEPKVLRNKFIQRKEPTRDNNYRVLTKTGRTAYGGIVERDMLMNNNNNIIYLDPFNTTERSFTTYQPSSNPSYLNKI